MPPKSLLPEMERRAVPIELRAAGNNAAPIMLGHAAVFDSPSEIMTAGTGDKQIRFREIIKPGAFTKALSSCDVRALFNHVPDNILGRTSAKTLRLSEDDSGLAVEIDPPDTTCGRDLQVSMRRGDIKEMSFGFRVGSGGDKWTRDADGSGIYTRTISEFSELYDVSPVTFPAYPETDCALRSFAAEKSMAAVPNLGELDICRRKLDMEAAAGIETRVNMGYAGYNSLGVCKMCSQAGCLCPDCPNMQCCNMQIADNGGCCTATLKPGCLCLGCINTDQCKMYQMWSM